MFGIYNYLFTIFIGIELNNNIINPKCIYNTLDCDTVDT